MAQSCPTLCNPMDCTHQAPPSMGFSRQEYWSGVPFPSPGDLPDPGIKHGSPACRQMRHPLGRQGSPLTRACRQTRHPLGRQGSPFTRACFPVSCLVSCFFIPWTWTTLLLFLQSMNSRAFPGTPGLRHQAPTRGAQVQCLVKGLGPTYHN